MLYNIIYYFLLFVCVFSVLAIVVFARDKEHTTCRLAKQLLENVLEKYNVNTGPMKNLLRSRM